MNAPGISEQMYSKVVAIVDRSLALEGPLLPILHAIQAEFGHVPDAVLPVIAEKLNLTRAEVFGVRTFYRDFRSEPAGRHVLKVCRAEACQSRGGKVIEAQARKELGLDWGQTSADGAATLEPVYCLGLCALGPAAMLDGKVHARLDAAALDHLIAECRS